MTPRRPSHRAITFVSAAALSLASCGGGGGSGGTPSPTPTPTPTPVGSSYTLPAAEALSVSDVERIIAQSVAEAHARNKQALIVVADRPGNVLAVFRMTDANALARISAAPNGDNRDAQNQDVPATAAAIAKAITGAYLSSGGNAFTTRTASMIVQQHFPPTPVATGLESGPLYGVQFSQLPCSDLNARYIDGNVGTSALIGPKRSPLGLAADPGGIPIYKNGVLVGGIGVMSDGVYGFDANVTDVDADDDEFIALAGTKGFEAPIDIRADRIPVDGTTLRYTDASYEGLRATTTPSFASLNGVVGTLIAVRGYYGSPAPAILAGSVYGSEGSGLRLATASEFARSDAMVLSNGAGTNRFPIRGGLDGGDVSAPLSATEARAILEEAFAVMARARAQIRRPLDSQAQVTISLVDTRGNVLGVVRSPDAPLFGIDVSLQKARSANFLSHPNAGNDLLADPDAAVRAYVASTRTVLGASALTGQTAFANRSIGLLHRPYFPDGEVGRAPGPLSRDIGGFNAFSTGLQTAMTFPDILAHLGFVLEAAASDVKPYCTNLPTTGTNLTRLANGLQIFPGAVPIYRNGILVGGLGVSGDGIDQDDMISFLGLARAGSRLNSGIGNAPADKRADQISVSLSDGRSARLRYVNCPFTPFLASSDQNVCQGL